MTNHEADILLRKIARGDSGALEKLYKEMSKPVYFYALRLVGNPETAEDVMQDTFISVMRNSEKYKGGKGTAWIFTIAKNRSADYLRRLKPSLPIDEAENIASDYSFTARSDSDSAFLKTLEVLNKKERDIVTLRLLGDMTLTQVADELALPKGSVFWSYNNAVKKLKKAYRGKENEK